MLDEVEQLSPRVREALEDSSNHLVFHQASSWEIQIKYQLGKLPLMRSPKEVVEGGLKTYGIAYHPMNDTAIWHLQKLPPLHRDPFDRMLISHALCEGLKLVTPDPLIHPYPVATLW